MSLGELDTRPRPELGEGAWIAPGAVVWGDVRLGPHASIWYGCVLRGDIAPIRIGAESNVQDLTTVHVDVDRPCVIGDRVGIGHRAIVHGCEIGDECLVGMGAIVLSHAIVGAGSVIAAGALVPEGMEVPPGSLVVGVPGRIARPVDEELRRRIGLTVAHYRALKEAHRAGRWRGPADGAAGSDGEAVEGSPAPPGGASGGSPPSSREGG